MLNAPLAFAFGAGMVATVNPCGFAMLPAYLSYFLGLEGQQDGENTGSSVPRALAVGGVMTLGFVIVFGVIGFIIANFTNSVQDQLPWATIVIGIGLVGLGIAMVAGKQISVRIPKFQKGGGSRDLPSMFLFGVSYAVASLSCTIGPFLAVTAPTFRSGSVIDGTAAFVFYGLGMGALITVLTLGTALAKNSILTYVRHAIPYINRISGALLITAGAYVAWYGWFEVRQERDPLTRDPIVDRALEIQSWINNKIQDFGTERLGLIAAGLVALTIVVLAAKRLMHRNASSSGVGSDPILDGEPKSPVEA